MLKKIYIKNFILMSEVEIEFGKGLNIITGETGSGKSVLIEALIVLLGSRAGADLIRTGEDKAVIEGCFEPRTAPDIEKLLADNDIEYFPEELIIRREIREKGTTRAFVNDTPVSAGFLKQLAGRLTDFHGQHDNRRLLEKEYHISIIDAFAGVEQQKSKFAEISDRLGKLVRDKNALKKKELDLRSRYESQRIELKEIEAVSPEEGEEEKLVSELARHADSEKIIEQTSEISELLDGEENSVRDKLRRAIKLSEELSDYDNRFAEFAGECRAALISVEETAKFASSYGEELALDPRRAEFIAERIRQIKGLRKKYGSFDGVIERKEFIERELSLIENFDEEITRLEKEIDLLKNEAGRVGESISAARKLSAKESDAAIAQKLEYLGIVGSEFVTDFKRIELEPSTEFSALSAGKHYKIFPDGIDICEFLISANSGEAPRALAETASGGEISRVMLAIKSRLADCDDIPTFVFDEIDTGISGKTARKVGLTMLNLSESHQIIAVTHLPQIASLAETHLAVRKFEQSDKTFVSVETVAGEEHIVETARLLSGDSVTQSALDNARELTLNTEA